MTLKDNGDESILQEAQRLTHGDRAKDYGHPLDDYTRTAALINALLAHKLKAPLDAEDAAQIQILVKLSRHQNVRKRDNMTDAAGYAWVAWECTEERERRAERKPHELDEKGNCPECLELSKLSGEKDRCPGCGVAEGYTHYPGCTRSQLDPRPRCEVHSTRIAPVIGCWCTACSRTRTEAATRV